MDDNYDNDDGDDRDYDDDDNDDDDFELKPLVKRVMSNLYFACGGDHNFLFHFQNAAC